MRTRPAAVLLILPLYSLLGAALQGPVHRFERTVRDGVELVTNTGAPKYEGELFTYEEILTIEPSEDVALLARPEQFLSDETGRYFVYDGGWHTILVFDPQGAFLNTIGRQGSGPGEFRSGRIMSVRGGVLLFMGPGTRIQRFRVDGTFIDVQRIKPEVEPVAFEGHILENGNHIFIRNESDAMQHGTTSGVRVIMTNPDDGVLLQVTGPQIQTMEMVRFSSGGQVRWVPMPLLFGPYPAAHYGPSLGLVVSKGDSPDLFIYGPDGEARRKIHVDLPPEAVTARDREAAREAMMVRAGQVPEEMRPAARKQIARLPVADEMPYWTDFEIDASGYIWLKMATAEPAIVVGDFGADELGYRVIGTDGEYLGITHRPSGYFSAVSHGRLLVLETDEETGLRVPTVYAIHPAVQGLEYP